VRWIVAVVAAGCGAAARPVLSNQGGAPETIALATTPQRRAVQRRARAVLAWQVAWPDRRPAPWIAAAHALEDANLAVLALDAWDNAIRLGPTDTQRRAIARALAAHTPSPRVRGLLDRVSPR
jgi:hypothetical protein